MGQERGIDEGESNRGAMTTAMRAVGRAPRGAKVLRIGLLRGGDIVNERVLRKRASVSIGPSEKNDFIVQGEGLPSTFELFELVGEDYVLHATEGMTGRVALPSGMREFAAVRDSVRLDDRARGKVSIGDATLLFQFVTPTPAPPRPRLPMAARGGFVKGIDWDFTAFVVLSYMLFFGAIILLENADFPVAENLAAIPEHYQQLILEEPAPPPEPAPIVDLAPEQTTEPPDVVDDSRPDPDSRVADARSTERRDGTDHGEGRTMDAATAARIVREARAQAEALMLGAFGDGALSDVIAGGQVTANSAEVIARAAGVQVADARSGQLRPRDGGGGSGQRDGFGRIRRSASGGMAAVEGPAITEREVEVEIDVRDGGEIGGSGVFDQAVVVRMIRARQSALRRCYETSLGHHPALRGRVVVKFTIEERGTVSGAEAIENTTGDPALGACVTRVIRRLRWTNGPTGGSVQFAYPFIFAPQGGG